MAAEDFFIMMALVCTLEASTRVLWRAMQDKFPRFGANMTVTEEHMTQSNMCMQETSRMNYGTAMAKFLTAMALDT